MSLKVRGHARASEFVGVASLIPTTTAGGKFVGLPRTPWKHGFYSLNAQDWSIQRDKYSDKWRFEIRDGDGVPTVASKSELQTIYCYSSPEFNGCVTGEFWQAWSFLVEPGPASTAQWCILGQWHATEDGASTAPARSPDVALSPPLCLDLKPGDLLSITTRTEAAEQQTGTPYPTETFQYQSTSALRRGVWHSVVINARFGWASDAKLSVWINGQQVVAADNINMGYNDLQGPHWNFGVYRGRPEDDTNTFAVQYANMEFSQSSLLSRVASPLPIRP